MNTLTLSFSLEAWLESSSARSCSGVSCYGGGETLGMVDIGIMPKEQIIFRADECDLPQWCILSVERVVVRLGSLGFICR